MIVKLNEAFNDISFDEGPHTYTNSSGTKFTSVTTFVGKYSQPFDAKAVAARKCSSKEDMDALLKQWEDGKNYACTFGTELHKVMENLWNRKVYVPQHGSDIEMYLDFKKRVPACQCAVNELKLDGYVPVATEFIVYDDELKLAGCIDAILYNTKTNRLCIFDWKTNKEIRTEGFRGKNMEAPFDSLPECELSHYQLQLSIYKAIIERNTDLKVDELMLVHFKKDGTYERIPVVDRSGIFLENFTKDAQTSLNI